MRQWAGAPHKAASQWPGGNTTTPTHHKPTFALKKHHLTQLNCTLTGRDRFSVFAGAVNSATPLAGSEAEQHVRPHGGPASTPCIKRYGGCRKLLWKHVNNQPHQNASLGRPYSHTSHHSTYTPSQQCLETQKNPNFLTTPLPPPPPSSPTPKWKSILHL